MATLLERVRAEQEARRKARGPDALLDFVPYATPGFLRPAHLEPLAALLERSMHEPVRACVSLPPRHAKTELILHAIAWKLARDPRRTFAFVSYADDFAAEKCARAREIAKRAGVRLAKRQADYHWQTPEGGGCYATGVGGQLVGRGFTDIIVDDPIKNREEAESPTHRNKVYDGFQSNVATRLDPRGTSILVVMTRWHPDDLVGRLIDDGWDHVTLPAIGTDEAGAERALWPEVWDLEFLRRTRTEKGPYVWEGHYQGNPLPKGNLLFAPLGARCRADAPPLADLDVAIGVDLAYSAKTRSDHSALVVLGRSRSTGRLHVLEVLRRRCSADVFAEEVRARARTYPGAPVRWYIASTERGSVDLMRAAGILIEGVPARGDKLSRALHCSATWAAGRVVVPEGLPWVVDFMREVGTFTGTGGEDDQVDAFVAAHDALVVPDVDRLLPSWDPTAHVAPVDLDAADPWTRALLYPEVELVASMPPAEPGVVLAVGVDPATGAVAVGAEVPATPGVDGLMSAVATLSERYPRARRLSTTVPRPVAATLRARRVGRYLDVLPALEGANAERAAAFLHDEVVRSGLYRVDPSCTTAIRRHGDAVWRRSGDGDALAPERLDDALAAVRRAVYPRLRRSR